VLLRSPVAVKAQELSSDKLLPSENTEPPQFPTEELLAKTEFLTVIVALGALRPAPPREAELPEKVVLVTVIEAPLNPV
jgi:hypothetical protein